MREHEVISQFISIEFNSSQFPIEVDSVQV